MTPTPTIRPLADYAEMKKAVDFQRLIWGDNFTELVPAVVFWFGSRIGGIVAGAFDESDDAAEGESDNAADNTANNPRMVGLIFGMTGWDGERPIHWSDMLGVAPSHRGRGLGMALKRYQRDRLLESGVTTVNWTFDPLEARNAHLNFARLGATSHEYIRDAYGPSSSPLHEGIGTDRLVVTWQLDSDRVRQRMDGAVRVVSGEDAEEINPEGEELRLDLAAPVVSLGVPGDIQALKRRDPAAAAQWRADTRAAFEAYLWKGYSIVDVVRDGDGIRYLLRGGHP